METELESKRNISEKWINNNIYEALETIEQHQRRMNNGCVDLLEYIKQLGFMGKIPEIQVENMKLMLSEFDILIENCWKILDSKNYKELREKLNAYQEIFHKGVKTNGGIMHPYKITVNQVDRKKTKKVSLTILFEKLAFDLTKFRSEVVKSLSPILYLIAEKKKEIVAY